MLLLVMMLGAVLLFVMGGDRCLAATTIGDPVSLSTLVGDSSASVVAGDKRFANFGYLRTGDMPAATAINVFPIRDDDGSFGIRFQGSFVDTPAAGSSDALVTYQAAVIGPQYRIVGARLSGDPSLTFAAGSISATETFYPLGPLGEYTTEIFAAQGQATQTSDGATFASLENMLNVQTDIFAMGGLGSGSVPSLALMSFVDEVFVQTAISPTVPGDYNYDNAVNAADFTVWRNSLGQHVTAGSGADGSGPSGVPNGVVDSFDFDFWKERYGQPGAGSGGASLASTPEPTSMLFVGVALWHLLVAYGRLRLS